MNCRTLISGRLPYIVLFLAVAVTLLSITDAMAIGRFWEFETSETGSTKFETLADAEAAMRAEGAAESYLQYTGEDNNDEVEIRRQYAAEQPTVFPDDNEAWGYKACDWGLFLHECGPEIPPYAPFPDETAALDKLLLHGYFGCGIESGPTATTGWWQGQLPDGVPAAAYQEQQVGNYDFVTKKNSPVISDCSILESHTATVYRTRTLQCPAGYAKIGPDSNGQFHCENNKTAEITRHNNAYNGTTKHCVGNPCDPATGSKFETVIDYVAPGIELSRTFRSNLVSWANEAEHIRRLPPFWTHSYLRVLRLDSAGAIPQELLRPDGSSVPVKLLTGYTDIYKAGDGSNTQVRPGAGTDEWDAFFPDGSMENYESVTCSGEEDYTRPRLSFIEDANGNATTVNYPDACSDHPDQIVGSFGHSISITYSPFDPDAPTYIEKITDSAGQDIVFGYSAGNSGTLDSVTYQDGKSLQYHYEDTQAGNETLLTGVTDEEGRRYSTFSYDFAGRATSTEHSGGDYSYSMVYDTIHTSISNVLVTDAAGNQNNYRLGGYAAPRVTSITTPNGIVAYNYFGTSQQRRLNYFQDENGVRTSHQYDDFHETTLIEASNRNNEKRTTTYEYLNDTSDLRTKTTRPSVCYDGTTRYAEDEIIYLAGTQTVSQVISRGYRMNSGVCEAIDQTVTFSNHNTAGQPGLIDGPRTDVVDTVTVDYYDCTTGSQCGQIESLANALGHVATFDGYDSHGRLLQMTDANGLVTNYAYDLRGRLTSITETPTVGSQRITSFTYEATDLIKTVTLPNGLVLTYDYNAAHRLRSITDNLGNHIDYGYDLRGNRTDEDVYDTTETLKRAVDYTFDSRNRLDTVNNGGFVTDFTFDKIGMPKDETDANSALTKYTYDSLRRLTQITDAYNGYTYFDHDVADNLVYVKTPIYDKTYYEYDDLGNLLNEISPDRGTLTYTFDEAGNRLSETDARGKLTTYDNDELNRLTLSTLDGGQTISYSYDLNSNGKGRLSSTVDSSGTTSWLYDQFGAVTQKQQTIGSVTLTTNYSYDSAGRMDTMTLPSGKIVDYGYTGHLLSSITVDSQLLLSGVTYESFGPVSGWTWGDFTVSTRTFDNRGLMTTHSLASDTRTLGRDPVGQFTTIDDARHDLDMNYDLLGRLKDFTSTAIPGGASLPGSQILVYDKNSNRTSLNEDGSAYSYSISTTSNRLLSTTGPVAKTYNYDAAGNVTSDGIHTYSYDDRGRLVDVDSGLVTYQHNALGQRVVKNNGTNTLFAYDEAGQLIGEYDSIGTAIQETVFFDGAPAAVLKGADIYEVHSDQLGTPRAITDAGTVIWRWESDPFGTTATQEDPDGDLTLFTYNLRFPGQYYDDETGLHYNYYRTYDPSTGRYLESDPIGLDGGLNTYGYVEANPLSFVDPLGLQAGPKNTVEAFCIRYPAECASVVAGGAGAYTIGQQLSEIASDASSTSTTGDPENCPDDDDEKKCERYKADARRIYNRLAADKIPEYMRSVRVGEGDVGHHMQIIQRQSALRIAIAGVRRNCKNPPLELAKWERLAYQEFPMRHTP